jgi:predicted nucleic acid-binding protein
MKYVIDSSVQVKTFVAEVDSTKAIRLCDEYRAGVHQLIAPDLFPTEIANVLMILERAGKLRPGDASLLFSKFLIDMPPLYPAISFLPRAIEIAETFRQSVYDSLYSALAEREGYEHVTADDKFLMAVQPSLPFVISLSSLP